MNEQPDLLSKAEAAFRLGGVSTRTVDRMCEDGQLVKTRVRGRALVTSESVDRFLGKQAAAAEPGRNDRPRQDWDGFEIPALDLELERRRLAGEERQAA